MNIGMQTAVSKGRDFIAETRSKMEQLVEDFADGKLNREQFHVLYERYQSQMNGVKLILMEADAGQWTEILDGEKTHAIRKRLLARAVGMVIYHNRTNRMLETLGEISADRLRVKELLQKLIEQSQQKGFASNQNYPTLVAELRPKCWLYIVRGEATTIITEFNGEPTLDQQETLLELLRDFERANVQMLKEAGATAEQLVMPFYLFVQRAQKR
jgi:hypothetical protein